MTEIETLRKFLGEHPELAAELRDVRDSHELVEIGEIEDDVDVIVCQRVETGRRMRVGTKIVRCCECRSFIGVSPEAQAFAAGLPKVLLVCRVCSGVEA